MLADDLTGAADCGVQAVRCGLSAAVALDRRPERWPAAAVVAVDLDTRSGDAPNARVVTEAAAAAAGATPVYVKLDSTLRGHVGAAVDAALAGTGAAAAVVAPAFPGQGRTTAGGRQRLRGEEVADLLGRLRAQSAHPVAHVGLDGLGAGGLATALSGTGARVVACDAVTDEDLRRVVAQAVESAVTVVWAGSAGLAAALAERLGAGAPAHPPAACGPPGPVLAVVGSVAAGAGAQLAALLERPGTVAIEVDPEALVAARSGVAREAGGAIAAALGRGGDPVLHLRQAAPRLDPTLAPRISAGLARAAALGIAARPPAGLLLTGGATARAVCDRAGIDAFTLSGEVEPGVPLGCRPDAPYRLVTKAGAFGGPDTLAAAFDRLKASTP